MERNKLRAENRRQERGRRALSLINDLDSRSTLLNPKRAILSCFPGARPRRSSAGQCKRASDFEWYTTKAHENPDAGSNVKTSKRASEVKSKRIIKVNLVEKGKVRTEFYDAISINICCERAAKELRNTHLARRRLNILCHCPRWIPFLQRLMQSKDSRTQSSRAAKKGSRLCIVWKYLANREKQTFSGQESVVQV